MRIDFSIAASGKIFGHVFGELIAVTRILHLLVGHDAGLVPDADDDALSSSNNAGTTTALSGKVDRVILGVVLDEHVLLVGNSDASLGALSVALCCLEHTLEFIHRDLLLGSIFLREVVLVGVECETWGSGPSVTVESVDCCEFIHLCQRILLSVVIELVYYLMEISVPT